MRRAIAALGNRFSPSGLFFAGFHLVLAAVVLNPFTVATAFSSKGRLSTGPAAALGLAAAILLISSVILIAAALSKGRKATSLLAGGFITILYAVLIAGADIVLGIAAPVQVGGRLDVPAAEVYGWAYAPYQEISIVNPDTGETYIERANSSGWRDVEHEPNTGRPRILLLGDSQVFGWGLPMDETIGRHLERELAGDYDVVSMGVSGFSTDQQYLALRNEGLRWNPRHVILVFTAGNDVIGNISDTEMLFTTPKPRFDFVDGVLEPLPFEGRGVGAFRRFFGRSHICRTVRLLWARLTTPEYSWALVAMGDKTELEPDAFKLLEDDIEQDRSQLSAFRPEAEWSSKLRHAWNVTFALLKEANDLCQKNNATFTIYSNSKPADSEPEEVVIGERSYTIEPGLPNRILKRMAEETGIHFLVNSREMEERRETLHFKTDPHYNAEGSRAAARNIADHIRKLDGETDRENH